MFNNLKLKDMNFKKLTKRVSDAQGLDANGEMDAAIKKVIKGVYKTEYRLKSDTGGGLVIAYSKNVFVSASKLNEWMRQLNAVDIDVDIFADGREGFIYTLYLGGNTH
jgi:hypothetical protein